MQVIRILINPCVYTTSRDRQEAGLFAAIEARELIRMRIIVCFAFAFVDAAQVLILKGINGNCRGYARADHTGPNQRGLTHRNISNPASVIPLTILIQ